ncbi:MAG: NAD(P)H-dependent oxidoreductase [Bdellovibrionales bacterium]
MKKTLVLFAHPNHQNSKANRIIIERIRDLPNVTIHNLYEEYPYFFINVQREQKLLLEHDLIVLQHPFYWYSMPALLKEWLDVVLESGFAYGPGGNSLKGKRLLLSMTVGGPSDSYQESGYNHFPIESFLPLYIQTARLCGMHWEKPLMFFGSIRASQEAMEAHAEKVRDHLVTFSNKQYQPGMTL